MKKKDKSNKRVSERFARKYIIHYYAFFWIVLICIILFINLPEYILKDQVETQKCSRKCTPTRGGVHFRLHV